MQDGRIKLIADHYHYIHQAEKTIEELTELTLAIIQERKACTIPDIDHARSNIIGEIADVKIMVEQLEYLLKAEVEVKAEIDKKLNRQIERMKREGWEEK